MLPQIFLDNKKRNLILWLTDMILAIASYFYLTNPAYIQKLIDGIDFANIQPGVDPEVFRTPQFVEFMFAIVNIVAPATIIIIAFFHTLAFYKCYQRKRGAIAYVKIYSFMAAASLLIWFAYNISLLHILILIPAAIYFFVFMAERQPPQQIIDNVLNRNV